ncbi:MAG: VOC family protein [Burkholderiales bacterium]|jgi:catechol 2,3-dioxygenase-like lactoylglutathione lyase family enzyme|nr:VOC family protein [Burkholderiales bacterium]
MTFNAGIITTKFVQTKAFYIEKLGFELVFENEFYVLLTGFGDRISFLKPEHPTQAPIFRPVFAGRGVYLTIDVEDVDAEYARLKARGVPMEVDLRDEPWGDRHFAVVDPNGIGIDFVTYTEPGGSG